MESRGRRNRLKRDRSESRREGLGERGQLFPAFVKDGRSDLSLLFFGGPGEPLRVKILLSHKVSLGYTWKNFFTRVICLEQIFYKNKL